MTNATGHSTASGAGPAEDVGGVCPICRTVPAESDHLVECPHCRTVQHAECWEYNRGCAKYGCPSAPPTDKLSDLEIPPAYWGQSEKQCPACRQMIQAAALRCRFCGTTFETARPQGAGEFQVQQSAGGERRVLRRNGIVMLVLAILPFTAPLAAIIAPIWYMSNRERIASLPSSQSVIPKVAVVVAVGQTAVLVAAVVLYSLFADGSGRAF